MPHLGATMGPVQMEATMEKLEALWTALRETHGFGTGWDAKWLEVDGVDPMTVVTGIGVILLLAIWKL